MEPLLLLAYGFVLASILHPGHVAAAGACGLYVGAGECAAVVDLHVPAAALATPGFNSTVEAKAAIMLAGMAGGDALRKPCGTFSGKCCRNLRELACRFSAADAARELTPSIPVDATLACNALTPAGAFTTCNQSKAFAARQRACDVAV
jgi:hypothetical protein